MTPEELAYDGGIYEVGSSSWTRVKLGAYVDLPAEVPEIARLFYPGRRHLVSGPGEAMKTWLCLAGAVDEIKSGRGVIWADLDGMGPRDITARLIALGVTPDQIDEFVYFTNPAGQLESRELVELLTWASSTNCRLLVMDAFTGFLVAHSLDGNSGSDVQQAWERLDPLLDAGIAVVLIDHVVKNADNRNGQAIGSERKGTAAHLHFDLKPHEKLARGGIGRSRINVTRDRGAHFPRPAAGELLIYSDPDTGTVTWTIKPPAVEGEPFRPTVLMERVSRYVETNPAATQNTIETSVDGKATYVRDALNLLVAEGYVSRETGANRARLHNSLKPYREAEDVFVPSASPNGTN